MANNISAPTRISDHAIVRYLERIYHVDVTAIKNEILSGRIKEAVPVLGNGKYPIAKGGTAIVVNNTVVTVIE